MRVIVALLPLALLAACNRAEDAPGAIGADDQRQLNEAAAMLDANSVDIDAVTQPEAGSNASKPE
jgi:hypothetical protein